MPPSPFSIFMSKPEKIVVEYQRVGLVVSLFSSSNIVV